jgi:hypothetical protein
MPGELGQYPHLHPGTTVQPGVTRLNTSSNPDFGQRWCGLDILRAASHITQQFPITAVDRRACRPSSFDHR